ncbi:hypothetical protein DER46DRAFT_587442 [Fusarium sp. MPI-SDFR-AT-0072]|nr:hypothetical protein DER46DRAFT_587442 [Fusarium sp. MPI-SDFR-AT-0072]
MMHLQKNGKDTGGSDGHLDTEARSTGSDLDSGGSASGGMVGESGRRLAGSRSLVGLSLSRRSRVSRVLGLGGSLGLLRLSGVLRLGRSLGVLGLRSRVLRLSGMLRLLRLGNDNGGVRRNLLGTGGVDSGLLDGLGGDRAVRAVGDLRTALGNGVDLGEVGGLGGVESAVGRRSIASGLGGVLLSDRADGGRDRDSLSGDGTVRAVLNLRAALGDSVDLGGVDSLGGVLRRSVAGRLGVLLGDGADGGRDGVALGGDGAVRAVLDGRRALGDGVNLSRVDGLGGVTRRLGVLLSHRADSGGNSNGLSDGVRTVSSVRAVLDVVRALGVGVDSSGVDSLGGVRDGSLSGLGTVGSLSGGNTLSLGLGVDRSSLSLGAGRGGLSLGIGVDGSSLGTSGSSLSASRGGLSLGVGVDGSSLGTSRGGLSASRSSSGLSASGELLGGRVAVLFLSGGVGLSRGSGGGGSLGGDTGGSLGRLRSSLGLSLSGSSTGLGSGGLGGSSVNLSGTGSGSLGLSGGSLGGSSVNLSGTGSGSLGLSGGSLGCGSTSLGASSLGGRDGSSSGGSGENAGASLLESLTVSTSCWELAALDVVAESGTESVDSLVAKVIGITLACLRGRKVVAGGDVGRSQAKGHGHKDDALHYVGKNVQIQ